MVVAGVGGVLPLRALSPASSPLASCLLSWDPGTVPAISIHKTLLLAGREVVSPLCIPGAISSSRGLARFRPDISIIT